MATDPNASPDTQPSGSLPPTLLNPDDASYFKQPPGAGSLPPTKWQAASYDPNAPTPTPTPTLKTGALPPPSLPPPGPAPAPPSAQPPAPPGQKPATAPPTPLTPPAPPAAGAKPDPTKLVDPPAGAGVNWAGETDVLKQRVDALYGAMPPELRAGTQVASGFRTYQQQSDIYAESDQGQKFMAASPGHSHHEQGTALDWHFGSPQAKQWLYENAGRYGLAFPFPDKDSGHMQLAEYGEGTQKGRAPQPGSATYLPDLEKVIDSKEGGFPGAVSSKGAEGTHQILLSTAQEFEPGVTAEQLQDPVVNDRIFHKIVRQLSNRYPGDPQAVMVAYNAGPGVANKWLAANRDPSVLPAETQKYIGAVDLSAGSTPSYQTWQRSIDDQRQTLQEENADLARRMKDMEAGSPEQRKLADQLLRNQLKDIDKFREERDHPPTQKPYDMIGNFGSLATFIGIFAGRFAHRPMVASLSAAGAAMQAMNDRNYDEYQNAFKTWKTQTDMTHTLISMESDTYKNIMEDRKTTMDEKVHEMEIAAKMYQNRLLSQQLQAGEIEKAWDHAEKLDKAKDDHAYTTAQIEEIHAKAEKERADAAWGALIPAGEEGAAIKTKLSEQAAEGAQNAQPGETPKTPQELAHDPVAVDKARLAVEADKKGEIARKYPLVGGGEEGAAIMTELTAQADREKANPPAGGARTVDQLAKDGTAVSEARTKVEAQKAGLRFGKLIDDDGATMVAGELMKGDTSGMVRLSPESRDKVREKVKELVLPRMLEEYTEATGGTPPDALARQNIVAQIGVQLASARAEFTGFTQYQRSLAIRQAAIDTAIAEAQNVIPVALEMNDKVPRSRFPDWNSVTNAIARGTGGEDVVKLNQVTNSLAQIYARAVTPTGQATDLVRQKAYENLTAAYSQGQYKAAISIMKLEMDAAEAAPEDVRKRREAQFLANGTLPDLQFLQHGVGRGAPTPGGPPVPKPGDVVEGHRFKGGDPANPNNWELVK